MHPHRRCGTPSVVTQPVPCLEGCPDLQHTYLRSRRLRSPQGLSQVRPLPGGPFTEGSWAPHPVLPARSGTWPQEPAGPRPALRWFQQPFQQGRRGGGPSPGWQAPCHPLRASPAPAPPQHPPLGSCPGKKGQRKRCQGEGRTPGVPAPPWGGVAPALYRGLGGSL